MMSFDYRSSWRFFSKRPGSTLGLFLGTVLCAVSPASQQTSTEPQKKIAITAGPDWVPLRLELDIEPGSALDFSRMGLQDAPAGKYGRVIATADGQFAFERDPKTPRRFYGINLCNSGQYMTHQEADRLADRLMRLGYNTVRFHHYERILSQGQRDTTTLNPEILDQFDYFFAALANRGIYLTTDLFVSRPVTYREIGEPQEGPVGMDHFKTLVPVHPGAWENWKQFSRILLNHVNPYTKRRYADDPALALLSLINEGNFGNFFADLRKVPEWNAAWNKWLAKRYADRAGLAKAWGEELKEQEDSARGSVAFPERLAGESVRVRDCHMFLSATEDDMVERMKRFLRDDLGCRALITNSNGWTNHVISQRARTLYDYVDDHFYVDHPRFLEKSWQLPSRCPNTSPIAQGAAGGRDRSFTRLFDKPFTITEYNYSGPGRFRGVGGILTGALGALQGWSGIWRFAYSHNHDSLFAPARMGYFDMASDPLGQAAERASLCLFLRGDMRPARNSIAIVMTSKDFENVPLRMPALAARWHWTAWLTRVGSYVKPDAKSQLPYTLALPLGWEPQAARLTGSENLLPANPYGVEDSELFRALQEKGLIGGGNPTNPMKMILKSETGEITIDGAQDQMILETAKTAGGYARIGQSLQTRDGSVSIQMDSSDATVWVSSLDGQPITSSRRLLLTHLTDLQNTDIQYAEEARQTLLDWGRLPHLVRAGKANIRIKIDKAARFQVWALSTSGRRVAQVETTVDKGYLRFQTDVARDPAAGARMLYEIEMK